jgi:hypothetical protein
MANNSIGAYAQGGSNEIGAYEYAGAVVTALLADDVEMASEVSIPSIGVPLAVGSEEWWRLRRIQYRTRFRKGWWKDYTE